MTKAVTRKQLIKLREKLTDLLEEYAKLGRGISEAASHGGATLSKIPEYAALTDQLRLLEGRINHLREEIASAQVIDPKMIPTDRVTFLSRVRVVEVSTGSEEWYSFDEEDIGSTPVSQGSPIGQALLSKKIGDVAEVILPAGKCTLEIAEIVRIEEKEDEQ